MVRISIIVATKNEDNGPHIIKELQKAFGSDCEIIVVDKSAPKYRNALLKTGAKVVGQSSDGYENAVMEGFALASGDILANIDADGTHSVKDFKRVVEELERSKKYGYGLVTGNRYGNMSRDAMAGHIKFGNMFLTKLFNLLYRQKMHDVMSGDVVMTREAYNEIKDIPPYRAGCLFFEIELLRRGFKIKDIPISYKAREGTASKITRAKPIYGLTIAYHAVRYTRDYNPLLLFGSIGVILIIAGLVITGILLSYFIHTGSLLGVGRALIAFMLLTFGFLSIIAGLILDLLLEIEKKLYRRKQV
jgi:glycosyltransferase involved in cell wall biosynthesis